jgi:hypothetical protein
MHLHCTTCRTTRFDHDTIRRQEITPCPRCSNASVRPATAGEIAALFREEDGWRLEVELRQAEYHEDAARDDVEAARAALDAAIDALQAAAAARRRAAEARPAGCPSKPRRGRPHLT